MYAMGCKRIEGAGNGVVQREPGEKGKEARPGKQRDQEKNGRKNGLVVFKRFPHHFQHLIKIAKTYIVLIVC